MTKITLELKFTREELLPRKERVTVHVGLMFDTKHDGKSLIIVGFE